MKYKPENVELVITHDGVEQEVAGFDESKYIQNQPPKKIKVEVTTTSKRCKDTIDWVEVEYGDAYEIPYEYKIPHVNKKPKKSSQGCKQNTSSTLVKHLTKSEIESLRQNKRDAYEIMMKMN